MLLFDEYGLLETSVDDKNAEDTPDASDEVDLNSDVDKRAEAIRRYEREAFRQYIAQCQQEREVLRSIFY